MYTAFMVIASVIAVALHCRRFCIDTAGQTRIET